MGDCFLCFFCNTFQAFDSTKFALTSRFSLVNRPWGSGTLWPRSLGDNREFLLTWRSARLKVAVEMLDKTCRDHGFCGIRSNCSSDKVRCDKIDLLSAERGRSCVRAIF